ncbi:methyltransferase/helicase [Pistachio ampelovirus A]|uniref:Methyltransferase/helicase n=1 Tax=Pistachio ampelovirus A TaxID=2093224 RepID=A0A499Q1X6_9CLOS|nr:methyltransferase/helicase [Pistachio ampelovirus A]AVN99304.1 methyltransferase/helicase [Pistachio ampelovirus A]
MPSLTAADVDSALSKEALFSQPLSNFLNRATFTGTSELNGSVDSQVREVLEDKIENLNKKPQVNVRPTLSTEQKQRLEELFPELRLKFTDSSFSEHPFANAMRECLNALMYFSFRGAPVSDIGGSLAYHLANNHSDVHVCNPFMNGKDVTRRLQEAHSIRNLCEDPARMSDLSFRKSIETCTSCQKEMRSCAFETSNAIAVDVYDMSPEYIATSMAERGIHRLRIALMLPVELLEDEGEVHLNDTGSYVLWKKSMFGGSQAKYYVNGGGECYTHDLESLRGFLRLGKIVTQHGACFHILFDGARGDYKLFTFVRVGNELPMFTNFRRYTSTLSGMYKIIIPVDVRNSCALKTLYMDIDFVARVKSYLVNTTNQTNERNYEYACSCLRSQKTHLIVGSRVIHSKVEIDPNELPIIVATFLRDSVRSRYDAMAVANIACNDNWGCFRWLKYFFSRVLEWAGKCVRKFYMGILRLVASEYYRFLIAISTPLERVLEYQEVELKVNSPLSLFSTDAPDHVGNYVNVVERAKVKGVKNSQEKLKSLFSDALASKISSAELLNSLLESGTNVGDIRELWKTVSKLSNQVTGEKLTEADKDILRNDDKYKEKHAEAVETSEGFSLKDLEELKDVLKPAEEVLGKVSVDDDAKAACKLVSNSHKGGKNLASSSKVSGPAIEDKKGKDAAKTKVSFEVEELCSSDLDDRAAEVLRGAREATKPLCEYFADSEGSWEEEEFDKLEGKHFVLPEVSISARTSKKNLSDMFTVAGKTDEEIFFDNLSGDTSKDSQAVKAVGAKVEAVGADSSVGNEEEEIIESFLDSFCEAVPEGDLEECIVLSPEEKVEEVIMCEGSSEDDRARLKEVEISLKRNVASGKVPYRNQGGKPLKKKLKDERELIKKERAAAVIDSKRVAAGDVKAKNFEDNLKAIEDLVSSSEGFSDDSEGALPKSQEGMFSGGFEKAEEKRFQDLLIEGDNHSTFEIYQKHLPSMQDWAVTSNPVFSMRRGCRCPTRALVKEYKDKAAVEYMLHTAVTCFDLFSKYLKLSGQVGRIFKHGQVSDEVKKSFRGINIFRKSQDYIYIEGGKVSPKHAFCIFDIEEERFISTEDFENSSSFGKFFAVCEDMYKGIPFKMLAALIKISKVGDIDEHFKGLSVTLENTPPGGGKTTRLVDEYLLRPELSLIVTANTGSAEDINKEIARRTKKPKKKVARTADSRVMNWVSVHRMSVLRVDECFLMHYGQLKFVACISKSKNVVLYGDEHQIPFINRLQGFKCKNEVLKPGNIKTLQIDGSYRCPSDVCCYLSMLKDSDGNKCYPKGVRKLNNSRPARSLSKAAILSVDDVPTEDVDVIMTYTQMEKKEVSASLARRRKKVTVMTVHEAQGKTFEKVAVVRTKPADDIVFDSLGHHIVAISRHTVSLRYFTLSKKLNDKLGKAIGAMSTVSDELLRGIEYEQCS